MINIDGMEYPEIKNDYLAGRAMDIILPKAKSWMLSRLQLYASRHFQSNPKEALENILLKHLDEYKEIKSDAIDTSSIKTDLMLLVYGMINKPELLAYRIAHEKKESLKEQCIDSYVIKFLNNLKTDNLVETTLKSYIQKGDEYIKKMLVKFKFPEKEESSVVAYLKNLNEAGGAILEAIKKDKETYTELTNSVKVLGEVMKYYCKPKNYTEGTLSKLIVKIRDSLDAEQHNSKLDEDLLKPNISLDD